METLKEKIVDELTTAYDERKEEIKAPIRYMEAALTNIVEQGRLDITSIHDLEKLFNSTAHERPKARWCKQNVHYLAHLRIC